ncbi:unnamed protein product [Scytosiphon promiscuus]
MNGRRCELGRTMTTKTLLVAVAALGLMGGGSRTNTVLAQQSSSSLSSNPDGCVTDYDADAGVDYFPDKATIEYAGTFSVEYSLTYKVLRSYGDFFDPTAVTEVYVLYQCGTPKPSIEEEVQLYISVPVTNVSTGTTDHIPRIELLGHRDSIVAYTGVTGAIGSPCVDALVDDGTVIQALTFDTDCQSDIVDNEALMNASVEVAFGDSVYTSYCENATVAHNGVGVVGYLESGPDVGLAHGEAIKLFSLFYNEEAKGNELFTEIESLMNCTKTNAQGCSLALSESPTVAWFPYLPTDVSSPFYPAGSGWDAPDEDAYYTQAAEFAGGTPLYCGEFEQLMTDEEMLECFSDADVCVFAENFELVEEFFNASALNALKCIQNETAYDFSLSGRNTWFEAIWVEPHVLVEDMVVVLHGDDFNFGIGSYERLLLRNVATEESGTGTYYPDLGTCDDPDAVVELQGECEVIVDFAACEDFSLTADGEADSPAAKALPTFLALVVAAAAAAGGSLWW